MATRQRVRAVLDARRASRPCWRCALGFPRHGSTSAAGPQESLKSKSTTSFERISQQQCDGAFGRTSLPQRPSSHAGSATKKSEVIMRPLVLDRPIVVRSRSKKKRAVGDDPARRLTEGQLGGPPIEEKVACKDRIRRPPATLPGRSQSRSTRAARRPRIRVESEGRRVALWTQSQSGSTRAAGKLRIRVETGARRISLESRSRSRLGRAVHVPPIRRPTYLNVRTHLSQPRPMERIQHTSVKAKKGPLARAIHVPLLRYTNSRTVHTHLVSKPPVPKEVVSGREGVDLASFIRKYPREEPSMQHDYPGKTHLGDSIEVDTMSPVSPTIRTEDGRKPQIPSDVYVHTTVERTSEPMETHSQKAGAFNVDRERLKNFAAPIIRKHTSYASRISPIIRKHTSYANLHLNYNLSTLVHRYGSNSSSANNNDQGKSNVVGRDDATRLEPKAESPSGARSTDATENSCEGLREYKAPRDKLTSLLDELWEVASNSPDTITETGDPISSPRSCRQYRGSADKLIHTGYPQYLNSSVMQSPTLTGRAASRHYATTARQTLQADSRMDPPMTGTNPARLVKEKSGEIRETLRLWQEQHDLAAHDSSGWPLPSTLSNTQNLFTQSGGDDNHATIAQNDELDDDDDVKFESEEQSPDIFARQVFLRRGDLVELLGGSDPVLAIFVRNVRDVCQFYTIRGEWVNRKPGGVLWGVTQFMDRNILNDILPYLPPEKPPEDKMNHHEVVDVSAPRDAGAKVIEQMSLFHRAADAIFRQHAERINRVYEIIAPPEGSDRVWMSLKDITMKVLMIENPSELTQPMMWTIYRAISQCQNITWGYTNNRQNPVYEVVPWHGLKHIQQVGDWVREYQEEIIQETNNEPMFSNDRMPVDSMRSSNPIATFVQKAQFAIQQSRRTRPLSSMGSIGPSTRKVDIEVNTGKPYSEMKMQRFDDNEKTIIHYLDVWTASSYLNKLTNLASFGPMILRATGMYEGFTLDEARGFTLLQELGVLTPWENRTVYKVRGLNLPGHDDSLGDFNRMLSDASTEAKNLAPEDSMEGLRRDWGDMPVFCIDSAETVERDDGISLELVDNDPSAYWVHIHVANPSAFIPPDSARAQSAASLAESVYFPERRYPMLDPKVTEDHLSLANDRPCITFSAKISADGVMLEKKITPGIVRNVHYLTPQMAAQNLGLTGTDKEPQTVTLLTVGGRMPTRPVNDMEQSGRASTDPEHIKALRKLLELSRAARQQRAQGGSSEVYISAPIVSCYPTVYLGKDADSFFRIENEYRRQFEGDPIITLHKTTEGYGLISKMIAELMIIAGDVSASWCSERSIPIPYRGILRNPEPASSPEAFQREVLQPKIAKFGHAEQDDLLRFMRLVGRAECSDRPLEHLALGLPAYCKTTSPLRRFIDLYTHWQIEAAIRHEAATGTSLVGSSDGSYLPFSRAQVAEFAANALQRERRVSIAKTMSKRHWICQALFRAFYFHEASLPETFEVRTLEGWTARDFLPAWWDLFNIRVRLQFNAAAKEAGWRGGGDVWEVKLLTVDPYWKLVWMEPIRLVGRRGE